LTGQGYRLAQFSAYSVAGAERFAAIFEQDTGPTVRAVYGLSSDQYQQRFDELTKQGYRLVQFSAYTVG
jgi:CRISPR/Cas system-associated protein endoribonuclease Cas2